MKVGEIKRGEKGFPIKLMGEMVKPAVEHLWYRGSLDPELFGKCVAVVGSRRMSRYGRQAITEIVPRLCASGYSIVSGLMYGVDQLVHKATLECHGKAIAVLGYGIARKNEETADRMAEEIENSGGVVLSEYEGTSRGQLWTFPQRNRIVVGLSDMIAIIEAGAKSGSLDTAKWATKLGKPIYALPGPIFSPVSEGTNGLLAEGRAIPLTLTVLNEIVGTTDNSNIKTQNYNAKLKTLNAGERELYSQLELMGPQSTNELTRVLNLTSKEILPSLVKMEMKELVKEDRGVWSID